MDPASVVLLVMHGAVPADFPESERAEFFRLKARYGHAHGGPAADPQERRFRELDLRMRSWRRTHSNDLFWASSTELAAHLGRELGMEVRVAFNEFCDPDIASAIEALAREGRRRVYVATPMLTRGGVHSEREIPEEIRKARNAYPDLTLEYVWPIDPAETAVFLAARIRHHRQLTSHGS
ncbi:MAG: hypothetical protein MOGMAGMI_02232 [Candidatus Omnitrophica bacterium]|nr:hypothetical protein [Candidatus Omnitrophota bacterium]